MATGEEWYKSSVNKHVIPILKVGEVINIDDTPFTTGRIQVRLEGVDKDVSDADLPYCVSLLPRFLNVLPKVGEMVLVFQYEHQKGSKYVEFSSQRFWIGPVISQLNKLEDDPIKSARSVMTGGQLKLENYIKPNTTGVYPNKGDIALQGRDNTDLIFKNEEVWIRAGKFKDNINKNEFNQRDLGYIQLKYGGDKIKRTLEDKIITNYIYDTAEKSIEVKIDTINSNNEVMAGNLTNTEYTNTTSTIVRIKVTNIKTNIVTFEQNFTSPGFPTREQAITQAQTIVTPLATGKWKLKSNSNEILKIFGGEDAVKNKIAFFKDNKKEVRKTIKVVKLTKNVDKKGSVLNMVANKINLISHDGPHTFELGNPQDLITGDEQERINNEAHPIVYGDKLVEFLELVKTYVSTHIHNYHGMPATELPNKLDVLNFDLDSILNKNINSN